MRLTRGMDSQLPHSRTVLAAASVAIAGLLLAGCASDSPTAVGSNTDNASPAVPSQHLTVPPGNHAATLATHQLIKVNPTTQIMEADEGHLPSAVTRSTDSPFDLTFFGGPVVAGAEFFNIYVNCTTTVAQCWGTGNLTPTTFLQDLNDSRLIQVADQYNGIHNDGQYSVAELPTTFAFTNHTAQLSDIFQIVGTAALQTGAVGYHNIYHVFLPQGTDMCISATNCYSPDVPSTFQFCAFHGSVTFTGIGHVLFTVEPYQFVGGCVLPTQTRVIDGSASTVSHESMETITDPDLDAWFNALFSNEIGDICFGFRFASRVGHNTYAVQEEYSNANQDCTSGP